MNNIEHKQIEDVLDWTKMYNIYRPQDADVFAGKLWHSICSCHQVGITVEWLQISCYRQKGEFANANELSRLLLPLQGKEVPLPAELVHLVEHMDLTPYHYQNLRERQVEIQFYPK